MYQALYRKWRPLTFDEVSGQSHITDTLKAQVSSGRLSHAYLFTGTRGTGKTTCAKILSRAVNCEHPVDGNPCNRCASCRGILDGSVLDVLELDAASNNGVDQVRALRDEATYTPAAVKKRVYIIDEVHMLSTAAFNALLKILEEPPEHLMFILATTEMHKVPPTILSRCQRFSFKRILPEVIVARLHHVAEQENIRLTEDGATLLARLADGGMRDALSLLDQCAVGGGAVDRARVLDTLGLAGNLKTAHIFNAIRRGDAAGAITQFDELYESGKDSSAVLSELISLSRDLLIRQTAPRAADQLMTGGYDDVTLNTLCKNMPPERLLSILKLLEQAAGDCARSGSSRTVAEICLVQLCDPSLDGSNSGLAARVAALEAKVAQGVSIAPTGESGPDAEAELPLSQEPSKSVASVSPPPKKTAPEKPPAPKPAAGGNWPELVAALHGTVSPIVYPFLKKDSVCGVWQGNVLTVYFREMFDFDQVNRPEVVKAIADAASARAGRAIRAELRLGQPPAEAAPKPRGSVQDLVQFMRDFNQRAEQK